jgi:hypothetical protein
VVITQVAVGLHYQQVHLHLVVQAVAVRVVQIVQPHHQQQELQIQAVAVVGNATPTAVTAQQAVQALSLLDMQSKGN